MQKTINMPLWVFLGLSSIETRKGALILFWSAFIFTIFCIPLSYYLKDWSWAAVMFPISLWYWLCIKWVDKNHAWRV